MSCASCVQKIKQGLAELEYVEQAEVNLVTALACVRFNSTYQLDFDNKSHNIKNKIESSFNTKEVSRTFTDKLEREIIILSIIQTDNEALSSLDLSLSQNIFVKSQTVQMDGEQLPENNSNSPQDQNQVLNEEFMTCSIRQLKIEYYEQINHQSGRDIIIDLLKIHTRQFREITCHKVCDDNVLVGELRLECHGDTAKTRARILAEFSGGKLKPVLSVEIDSILNDTYKHSIKDSEKDDKVKNININNIITVHFDKNLIKPLELLHVISAVANVSVVTDDEQARTTGEMLTKLAEMAREQAILSVSGLPLLVYMLILAFEPDAAAPLLWTPQGVYAILWLLAAVVIFNYLIFGAAFHFNTFRSLRNASLSMDVLITLSTTSSLLWGLYLLIRYQIQSEYSKMNKMEAAHVLHMLEACNSIIWMIMFGKWLEKRATVHCNLMFLKNLDYSFALVRKLNGTQAESKARSGTRLTKNTDFTFVDSKLLSPGDQYYLHRNEEVPLDSIFRYSSKVELEVSEALITGESRPVLKRQDEEVYQGSTCLTEGVLLEVNKDYASSTFMQVKTIVRDSKEIKTSYTKYADIVISWMISCVLTLGILTVILLNTLSYLQIVNHPSMLAFSLECLISMVVVCCPCSIGLTSALVSVQVSALLNARGIIARKDSLVEDASQVGAVVFDKTGTLVDNHLAVAAMRHEFSLDCVSSGAGYKLEQVMLDKAAVEEVLQTLSRDTHHPVSLGIANAFRRETQATVLTRDYYQGQGLSGTFSYRNRTYTFKFGSLDFAMLSLEMKQELDLDTVLQDDAALSYVFFKFDNAVYGYVSLENRIKPEAYDVIRDCSSHNLSIHMFTGDREPCARRVAKALSIPAFKANMTPSHKKDALEMIKLKTHVLFVGDGINDAQVISAASIGIAIDTKNVLTCESADVVILGSDLRNVVQFLDLSRAAFAIIKQNQFWALVYNVTVIPLAGGWLQFWLGIRLLPSQSALAMMLSSLSVILNSTRLSQFKSNIDTLVTGYSNDNGYENLDADQTTESVYSKDEVNHRKISQSTIDSARIHISENE